MKIILTGATGFIGQETLQQCLQNPRITSIVALSRRELPAGTDRDAAKLKTVIMDDFTQYPESVLQEMAGAEACVWCMGSASIRDLEAFRRINIDYMMAGLDAIMKDVAPQLDSKRKPFRFVYVSGMATERDQSRSLWFAGDFRRLRGRGETDIINTISQQPQNIQAFIARPGHVSKRAEAMGWTRPVVTALGKYFPALGVGELAAALIDLAVTGEGKEIVENDELKVRGAQLLKGNA